MSNFWGPFFLLFQGQKEILNFFWKHYSFRTEKLHNTFFTIFFFKFFEPEKMKKTLGFFG